MDENFSSCATLDDPCECDTRRRTRVSTEQNRATADIDEEFAHMRWELMNVGLVLSPDGKTWEYVDGIGRGD